MSTELVTVVMFGGLLLLLATGLPIVFVMMGISLAVILTLMGDKGPLLLISNTFTAMTTLDYVALPLFLFMGVVLEVSGIADALFEMMYRWSGPVRGGLAMGTVVICTVFAAMTGVTGAATVTMGLIALPAMLKRGYSKTLAAGTIAGAGTLGILIPPSIFMVILAPIGGISVGKTFMGGVFPGLLLAGLFIGYVAIRAYFQPHIAPAHGQKFTLKEKIISIKSTLLPIFIILSVLGTIFAGVATPTEASAVGALACIIAVAVNRRLKWGLIKEVAATTARITGMCMWVFFSALFFSSVYAASGGVGFISDLILGVSANRWVILAIIMGIVFLLGCVLDPVAIIFLVAPIGFPLVKSLGFDPVWFAIIFIILIQLATMTPPYGYQLFYLRGVSPQAIISLGDIYRSVMPFILITILGLAIVTAFPQIVTWLPDIVMKARIRG